VRACGSGSTKSCSNAAAEPVVGRKVGRLPHAVRATAAALCSSTASRKGSCYVLQAARYMLICYIRIRALIYFFCTAATAQYYARSRADPRYPARA
jgi:hypothetical protein